MSRFLFFLFVGGSCEITPSLEILVGTTAQPRVQAGSGTGKKTNDGMGSSFKVVPHEERNKNGQMAPSAIR